VEAVADDMSMTQEVELQESDDEDPVVEIVTASTKL
jgi:hypothetical protein